MAGGQERILRRRIRTVDSTKKITRAMELIAGSRIVKAQQRVAAARPYADQITEVIRNLAAAGAASDHPLMTPVEEPESIAYIAVTADRGLCGAYNTNVLRATERAMAAEESAGRSTTLVTIGKKAKSYFSFQGREITSAFEGMSDQPRYDDAREVATTVTELFDAGEVQAVELVYTQFLSVGTQKVVTTRFMPIDTEAITEAPEEAAGPAADYEFEPGPTAILESLLPRYAEARLFAAMLDAAASEHAARQRAMKAATDNAEELKTKLTRIMNRARQDAITTEIMEIVGGAEALSEDKGGPEDLLPDLLVPHDIFPDRLRFPEHAPSRSRHE